MGKRPREGYVAEVWHGKKYIGKHGHQSVILEIRECYYDEWLLGDEPSYHYNIWGLDGLFYPVFTIGSLGLDNMREFAKKHSFCDGE